MKTISTMKLTTGTIISLTLWACSPSQYVSSRNVSADIKTRPAGFTDVPGRINLDCFVQSVNGNEFNSGNRPTSMGIPMNCPNSSQGAQADTSSKYDVAVVLDTSENMLSSAATVKSQLAQVLTKLNSDGRIGSLSAVSFRTKIVASISNGEIAKVIADIAGTAPEWSPASLKTIDPNSTDWVTNEAAKAVFAGIEEGITQLKAGSSPYKMLMLVSSSTGTGSSGKDIGPSAKSLNEFSSKLTAGAGQLIFNYAASNQLARGLSIYDPTAVEQLDLLVSTAALKPVRVLIPSDLGGWGEVTTARISTPVSQTEACPLTGFEATDASGQQIFKKDVPAAETTGVFEASLPESIPNGTLNLTISRKCARSGERTQKVTITLAATAKSGGAAK